MSSSSIIATKILFISSGVILLAMIMKSTIIPWMIDFTMSELPIIWSFLVSLCKPPYLYVVINGIIITIAASSRFTRAETERESNLEHFQPLISARTPPRIEMQHDMFVANVHVVEEVVVMGDDKVVNGENKVVEKGEEVDKKMMELVDEEPEVGHQEPQVVHQEPEVELPVRRKTRGLSRFGPPKASKPSPLGKREVVVEEDSIDSQEVTLESMWKIIMEGREEPLDHFMKKSDLLDDYTQKVDDERLLDEPSASTLPSSQHHNPRWYKGHGTYLCESPVKSWILKKEPSLGQDELNRRADAFIQKFNEEMRMQRQQSLMQNMEKTRNNYSS